MYVCVHLRTCVYAVEEGGSQEAGGREPVQKSAYWRVAYKFENALRVFPSRFFFLERALRLEP